MQEIIQLGRSSGDHLKTAADYRAELAGQSTCCSCGSCDAGDIRECPRQTNPPDNWCNCCQRCTAQCEKYGQTIGK